MAVREGQIALCHAMLDALFNKEVLLCEAGVGIGKTLAYLVACVLWQQQRPAALVEPVVISTSSVTLQEAILREYLPFLATEDLMMEAVKRGGDRQQLHEVIRRHSMAATKRMKEGLPCDLLDRLAGDPVFGLSRSELEQLMEPRLYIGRCPQQVRKFLDACTPLLRQAQAADGNIRI